MRVTLRRIVPVGYEAEVHLSASYREAPGLVYLTLHPDPVTLAEALIHETQHGKLNALSFFDAVLENGHTEWAPSPVRPDLRPLMGVLLAAHAFVPVAEFHRRLAELGHELTRTPAFARRRAEVLASNARGLAVLADKARPTPLGARVLAELTAMHARTSAAAGAAE
jgi:HEXXH motif-containing protein